MRETLGWRGVLDDTEPAAARRIARGQGYARAGRVTDVRLAGGVVAGRVHGAKATPHPVEIAVTVLSDPQWDAVVDILARQVRHSAQLLAGQVSDALQRELARRGVRLLPDATEIAPACPCDDPAAVCAHVAAVWEAAADRLAVEPPLLLRVRGRGRERLLADLAAARRRSAPQPPGTPLERLDVQHWSRMRAPLDVPDPGTVIDPSAEDRLQLMGDPPGWQGGVSAFDLLRPLVERGAAWARGR